MSSTINVLKWLFALVLIFGGFTVEIFNSFYLSEPVGRMPYLHWQSNLKCDTSYSFESEKWNMPDLFLDYFQRRWLAERNKLVQADKQNLAYNDFLYAPASARKKCTSLICELEKSNRLV